jgi:predicted ester cyclase
LREFAQDEDLLEKIAILREAFSNHRVLAEDIVEEGDKVAVRGRFQGCHTGDLIGLPPTRKEVDVPFFAIYRISEEKIVQHWLQMDTVALVRQIGAGVLANLKIGNGV